MNLGVLASSSIKEFRDSTGFATRNALLVLLGNLMFARPVMETV
jgi:hypothetical protein